MSDRTCAHCDKSVVHADSTRLRCTRKHKYMDYTWADATCPDWWPKEDWAYRYARNLMWEYTDHSTATTSDSIEKLAKAIRHFGYIHIDIQRLAREVADSWCQVRSDTDAHAALEQRIIGLAGVQQKEQGHD